MKIHVRTPARLHFGILNPTGNRGRKFGGVGLAVSEAGFEINVEKSEELKVGGSEQQRERVIKTAKKVIKAFDIPDKVTIEVIQEIPSHIGLGSTTQLTLALAKAISILHEKDTALVELAEKLGRGKRSGVGTYAFRDGGFVVEGGKMGNEFPPLVLRRSFPENWKLVVAIPDIERGFSETEEEEHLNSLDFNENSPEKICRRVLLEMLPALVQKNIESFGRAITRVDELTGEAFSSEQEGTFKDKNISELRNYMLEKGAYGAGQSSWGPTIYGLTSDEKQAEQLKEETKAYLEQKDLLGETFIATPNNEGASIDVTE